MADTPLSLQSLQALMQLLQPAGGGGMSAGGPEEGNGDDRQVDVTRTLVDRDPPASSRALSMLAERRGRIY